MQEKVIDQTFFVEKLEQINQLTQSLHPKESMLGVLNGKAGLALFQFYYAKYSNTETPADIGEDILAQSIESINQGFNYPTFCNGIAGLGWTLDHLQQQGLIDTDVDGLLSGLDNYLYTTMIDDIGHGKFDFLHGALGYGFYFLKRLQNTTDQSLKNRYRNYLFKLLEILKNQAEPQKKGIAWQSLLIKETQVMGYNLSLSHGLSSIINFLSRVYEVDGFKQITIPLLEGAIDYLLSHKTHETYELSLFPSWVNPVSENIYRSRLAWCYGDLGVAITLWQAAKSLGNSTLASIALKVFEHAAQRRSPETTFVKDASICHGSYGIARIFDSIYQDTLNPLFKETADFWMFEGANMAFHEDGWAGYKQFFMKDDKETWENKAGLLEGIAGIGLTIIDYLSGTPQAWDECLLIS